MKQSERTGRILTQVIRFGLYLTLLSPLFVWRGFLFPHLTAKVLGFQMLVEALLVATVGSIFFTRREGTAFPARIFRSPVLLSTAALLAYSVLSSIAGSDLTRSLWGFIDRQDGLVLQFHFLAWCVVICWFCTAGVSMPDTRRSDALSVGRPTAGHPLRSYLVFSFWVSVVVSVLGLWESGLLSTLRPGTIIQTLLAFQGRPAGAFGNPVMIGPYLAFHLLLGFAYMKWVLSRAETTTTADVQPRRGSAAGDWVHVLGIAFAELLIVSMILVGQTRGVIFGLLAGLLVSLALVAMDRQLGFRGRLVIAVGVVFIIAGSLTLWLFRRSDFIAQTPFLSRLTQVSVEENQSTENRLITWRSALQGAADRPVFGWGVNSAYYALNRYYNPRHALFTGNFAERSKTWYDKTHNAHIEMLLERGLAGAALYWISIFFALRYVRRISDRFLSRCLTAFLVAHLCSNAVAFDSYGSFFVFYLLLACIVVLGKPGSPPASATRRQRRDGGKSRPAGPGKAWRAPAAIAAGLVLVAGAYANVGIAMAVHGYARAREAFESDPAAGIAAYADAFRHFSPYHPRQKLDCAYLLVNSAITKRGASRSFEGGALFTRLTREALAAHPDDAEFYVLLNDTYNGLAVLSDKRFAAEAQGFGRKALELSPRRQEAIFTLARSYLLSNEPTRAVELNRQIVAHTPDFALGRWFLALSLLADGRPDEAKEQLRHAFRLGYRFQSEEERKSIVGLLGEAEYLELLRSK